MHPDEDSLAIAHVTGHESDMLDAIESIPVVDRQECAELRGEDLLGASLDMTLSATPSRNDLPDGHARKAMLLRESARLGWGEHRAGVRGELDAQRHRLLLGEDREVHGSLGSAGPTQHSTRESPHRRHMARSDQVTGMRARIGERP